MSERTIFTWTDGTTSDGVLKQITEGFAGKFGKQKSDLKEVEVGDTTKTIELNAFRLCKNLEKVVISDKVQDIKEFAFSWCDALREVKLPEGIARINISAFQGCSALESIVIPDSVTIIDEQAFSKCVALESVKLPEGMYWISNEAFDGCEKLKELDIPASVEIIDSMAFSNCTALEEVRFAAGSKLREFGPNAFENCPEMKLSAPEPFAELQRIGGYAFSRCEKLEGFETGNQLVYIGEKAFMDCVSLAGSINIPASLKTLGGRAFCGCSSLEEVNIEANQQNIIPTGAFAGCSSLKAVNGAECLKEIGAFAFLGCTALESIKLSGSLKKIDDWAFKGCVSLRLELPLSVTDTGTDALSYISACSYHGADLSGRQFYSSDTHRTKAEETLKLAAYDAAACLRRIHQNGAVPDEIAADYDRNLMLFIEGRDERSVTFDLMDEFDIVYGTEAFPFSAEGEIFRDKLYRFSREVRLG